LFGLAALRCESLQSHQTLAALGGGREERKDWRREDKTDGEWRGRA